MQSIPEFICTVRGNTKGTIYTFLNAKKCSHPRDEVLANRDTRTTELALEQQLTEQSIEGGPDVITTNLVNIHREDSTLLDITLTN